METIIKRASRCCVLLLVAAAWVMGRPAVASGPLAPHTPGELQVLLETILRDEHVPGIGIVMAADGKIVWKRALGLANVARNEPASEKTLYRIGDLSTGFVALAALELQEQGKLNLTDTLAHWAPEMAIDNPWEATDPVRLVHLLEDTSGLADMSLREYAFAASPTVSLRQALEFNRQGRKARWRPGSRAANSSVGPALVAYVIEKVTGQRFEDYVRQNLFLPMRMLSATYFEPQTDFAGQYAPDGVTALPYWNDLYRPSGAINASVEDMAQYLLLLVNRGSLAGVQVLTPAAIERLERPETLPMVSLGVKVAPGLGMLNTIEDGVHFRGHYGIVNGGLSELLYIPETRSGVIVMMNSLNPRARSRILDLLVAYLAQSVPQPAAPTVAHVDSELLEHYAGYYLDDSPISDRMSFVHDFTDLLHVTFTDRGMTARNVLFGFTEQWVAQTGRTFRGNGQPEPMVAMYHAQDGDLVMQSKFGTLRKVSALRACAPLVIGVVSILTMLSSLIVGLGLAVRKLLAPGKPIASPSLWLLPMAASALFFAIAVTLAGSLNLESLWGPWGRPTLQSITALVAGIAFLVLSVASVINIWRRRGNLHRIVYWHSALVAVTCLVVASYLLYWKAIGIPTWRL